MSSEAVGRLAERIREAQERFARQVASLEESQFHRRPAEGEWSPAEIVAHVCESPPYFTAGALRMASEDNPFVGRDEEGTRARLQAVAEYSKDSKEVALQRLRESNARVLNMLSSLSDEQLSRTGIRPPQGTITVQGLLESIATHLDEHTQQVANAVGRQSPD